MAKKESKLKQAARGATAPFKNVGRDTRRMLRPVPPPPAVALYPNDLGVLTGPTASTTVPMTALERLKAAAQGASAPFKNMGRDMRGEAAPVASMPGISAEDLQALAAVPPLPQASVPGAQASVPQIPMPSMTDVPPVNMSDYQAVLAMNMDPRTNTGLAGSFNSMDDSLARAASAIDAVAARQQARARDTLAAAPRGPSANWDGAASTVPVAPSAPELGMNSNAGLSPEDLAFIQRQRDAGQSSAPITSAYAFPGAGPGFEGSGYSPASPDGRGYGTPHFPGAAPGWNDQNPTSGAIASMLYPGAPKQMAESPPIAPSPAPQPGEINTWTPDQHAQAIADVTSGIDSAMKAAQRDATVKRWGPGTIQPMDAGSGAYNDGGRIGHISPDEMAAIEAGTAANPIAPRGMGRSSGVGQTGTPTRGYGSQAWNAGSPDTRDLSRIPLPPERVPASVQALPPDELAALQGRLQRQAPTGELTLSPSQPLQSEPGYPDLIAAARAKLAGQDVSVPTVVGSGRYAGGSAEAQAMQRASWQRARGARSARAIDQAGRMQNDPLTQYRAARAGNPIAGLQATLGALGGADSVNGRAFVLGPDNAARIELGNQDAAARQAAADAEAGVGRDFLQQKRESEIAAMAGQFMQADPSLTPEQARAKAASLFGVPAPQGPAIPPTIAAPGSQTLPGRAIGGLTDWYDKFTQDLEARGIPRWALGLGHGVMGAIRGK